MTQVCGAHRETPQVIVYSVFWARSICAVSVFHRDRTHVNTNVRAGQEAEGCQTPVTTKVVTMGTQRNREIELLISLRNLAWSLAKEDLDEAGNATAARTYPSNTAEPATTRRAGYIALLGVYTELQRYLRDNTDLAVAGVLATGGNFGDVARALGVSRQAARQRWQRAKTPTDVRLTGGPRNGETHRTWRDADVRFAVGDPDLWDHPEEQCWLVYRASAKDPRVYEFVGYEDSSGRITRTRPERTSPQP